MSEFSLRDRLLKYEEAAEILAMHPGHLRRLVSRDEAPQYLRLGRSIRFRYADLMEWAMERDRQAREAADAARARVERMEGDE